MSVKSITPLGNGSIAFNGEDSAHGFELWRTDMTAETTRMVRDINPGAPDSYPSDLTVHGGRLFFSADDGVHGRELWVYDGESGTAALFADLNAGSEGSLPQGLVSCERALFFAVSTPDVGFE
eukprot:3282686-Prymnesium_polylepis.1